MSNLSQRSGGSPPRPGGSGRWIDLIAFLAVLTLGGVLIALGRITAGSLATVCAALGGLYGVWNGVLKRVRSSNEASPPVEPDEDQNDERHGNGDQKPL